MERLQVPALPKFSIFPFTETRLKKKTERARMEIGSPFGGCVRASARDLEAF